MIAEDRSRRAAGSARPAPSSSRRQRLDRPVAPRERARGSRARETTSSARPARRAADVHVLDEADFGARRSGRTRGARAISSSLTPRITTVSILSAEKPGARRRGDPGEHARRARRSASAPGSGRGRSVSRLTVTRCRPAACRAAACSARRTPFVVSARSRIAGLRRRGARRAAAGRGARAARRRSAGPGRRRAP